MLRNIHCFTSSWSCLSFERRSLALNNLETLYCSRSRIFFSKSIICLWLCEPVFFISSLGFTKLRTLYDTGGGCYQQLSEYALTFNVSRDRPNSSKTSGTFVQSFDPTRSAPISIISQDAMNPRRSPLHCYCLDSESTLA